MSCPQPFEKFAQKISDAITKVEANKVKDQSEIV